VRQGLAVEPGVHIGGTAQRPVIRLISDPELPDTEKLAWLVLGHGSEQMSGSDATVLLSAAGGLLGNDAGGLLRQLKKGFGVDEFGIRQGGLGDTGSRGQSSRIVGNGIDTTASTGNQILSIGKRLSSNALLSYEQALGKAESIVKLTVNLNRQVALIGRAGSDNALDVFYTLTLGRSTAPGRGAKFPDRESP
jgi:translocation and assembly module TamB